MTTRTNLAQAHSLSAELDQVNQAIAIVAGGSFSQFLELTATAAAGVRVTLNVSAANLTTMLTNRQTALTSALTALGVT